MSKIDNADFFLNGRLLLAAPGMTDPRFHKAVIMLCAHDEQGAMGLVINQMLPELDLQHLFEQMEILTEKGSQSQVGNVPVLCGGPVETARGFVLHPSQFREEDTIQITDNFSVTATINVLESIAKGKGPQDMLFMLGYAGWAPGQLDEEIQQNSWLVIDPDYDLLFKTTPEKKWDQAINKLGIDPMMLSSVAGHA